MNNEFKEVTFNHPHAEDCFKAQMYIAQKLLDDVTKAVNEYREKNYVNFSQLAKDSFDLGVALVEREILKAANAILDNLLVFSNGAIANARQELRQTEQELGEDGGDEESESASSDDLDWP